MIEFTLNGSPADATGVRITRLPATRERVLQALAQARA